VAQLGARLDGIEEAVGSNPIGSTKFSHRSAQRKRVPVAVGKPISTRTGRSAGRILLVSRRHDLDSLAGGITPSIDTTRH
jgi:hypothetical protein